MLECREDSLGILSKIFRFTGYKTMTPFDVRICLPDGRQVVRVKRGFLFWCRRCMCMMKMMLRSDCLSRNFSR